MTSFTKPLAAGTQEKTQLKDKSLSVSLPMTAHLSKKAASHLGLPDTKPGPKASTSGLKPESD